MKKPKKPKKPRQPRVWRESQSAIEKALLPINGVERLFSAFNAPSGRLVFEVGLSPKGRDEMVEWFVAQNDYLAQSTRRG